MEGKDSDGGRIRKDSPADDGKKRANHLHNFLREKTEGTHKGRTCFLSLGKTVCIKIGNGSPQAKRDLVKVQETVLFFSKLLRKRVRSPNVSRGKKNETLHLRGAAFLQRQKALFS